MHIFWGSKIECERKDIYFTYNTKNVIPLTCSSFIKRFVWPISNICFGFKWTFLSLETSNLKTCVSTPAGTIASSNTTHSWVWKLNDWSLSQCGWRTTNVHPCYDCLQYKNCKAKMTIIFLLVGLCCKSSRKGFFFSKTLSENRLIFLATSMYSLIESLLVKGNIFYLSQCEGSRKIKGRSSHLPYRAVESLFCRTSSNALQMRHQSQHSRLYWGEQGEGAHGACAVHEVVA